MDLQGSNRTSIVFSFLYNYNNANVLVYIDTSKEYNLIKEQCYLLVLSNIRIDVCTSEYDVHNLDNCQNQLY